MIDYILVFVLLAIVGAAIWAIVRAKKKGQKCIGCPHSSQCTGSCNCNNTK